MPEGEVGDQMGSLSEPATGTRDEDAGEPAGRADPSGASGPDGTGQPEPPTRRVGRPPRIDRETIARAAGEIGLDQVSMRSVAERLGVSVPGLYHYVKGRDDLLRLAAERSVAKLPLPVHSGQHWMEWLFGWAEFVREAFIASPAMIEQLMHGSFGIDQMVDAVDTVIDPLIHQGFSPRDAVEAYYLISECALGAAVTEIRANALERLGSPNEIEHYRVLGERDESELPALRAAAAAGALLSLSFAERLRTVIIGLAARRGEPWADLPRLATKADQGRDTGERTPDQTGQRSALDHNAGGPEGDPHA